MAFLPFLIKKKQVVMQKDISIGRFDYKQLMSFVRQGFKRQKKPYQNM